MTSGHAAFPEESDCDRLPGGSGSSAERLACPPYLFEFAVLAHHRAKARDALVEHNITTREQLRGVTDHELADWFVDGHNYTQVLSHPHLGWFKPCLAFGNAVLSAA